MCSRPQAIENSMQCWLLRTDIYRKQSLGAPEMYVLQMKQVKKNFNAKLFS